MGKKLKRIEHGSFNDSYSRHAPAFVLRRKSVTGRAKFLGANVGGCKASLLNIKPVI
jgi:hypothetical protein